MGVGLGQSRSKAEYSLHATLTQPTVFRSRLGTNPAEVKGPPPTNDINKTLGVHDVIELCGCWLEMKARAGHGVGGGGGR